MGNHVPLRYIVQYNYNLTRYLLVMLDITLYSLRTQWLSAMQQQRPAVMQRAKRIKRKYSVVLDLFSNCSVYNLSV